MPSTDTGDSTAGEFQHRRERFFHAHDDAGTHGRRTLCAAALVVSVFILVLSLSIRQSTEPGAASNVIQAGVAVTTDIDRVLAGNIDQLRLEAQAGTAQSYNIPGYPLAVYLSREELATLSTPQLRALVLARSSALVYRDGLGAFDHTGHQSLSRFSSQGLLKLTVGELSQSTHDRASAVMLVSLIATVLSVVGLVVSSEGWSRMKRLGLALAVGTAPGVILFGLAWLLAGFVGGSDPFEQSLRDIARAVVSVPVRNFGVAAVLGGIIALAGIVLERIAPELTEEPAAAVGEVADHSVALAPELSYEEIER